MKTLNRLLLSALMGGTSLGFSSAAFAVEETPQYLTNIELDAEILNDVSEALPERSAIDQAFLNPSYNPNLRLSEDSQLAITFIDEGAGYRNSLGWFSFQNGTFSGLTNGGIDLDGSGSISLSELGSISGVETGLIFPNSSKLYSGGQLQTGDTTVIGGGTALLADDGSLLMEGGTVFGAGTNVGFFLAANAWNGDGVQGYDEPGDPNVYYTLDFLNPENTSDATFGTTTDASRHVAMLFANEEKDQVIMGFEDLYRLGPSDEDFNDAIFLVQSNPETALSSTSIAVHSAPAPALGSGLATLVVGSIAGLGFGRRRSNKKKEA